MNYDNLTIIGTSHIARESIANVEKAIKDTSPDIIALELDRRRLHALMSNEKRKVSLADIRRIGIKGFVFSWLGSLIQSKLGDYVGVSPGSEMKAAVELAKKQNTKIALIDQEIEITLRRFSQALTMREKWRIFADIIKGLVFRKNELEELGIKKIDLSKVPEEEVIEKIIGAARERYPSIARVLIDERNEIMASRLLSLMSSHPEKKIVAVIGAGHKSGIKEIIKSRSSNISYSTTIN